MTFVPEYDGPVPVRMRWVPTLTGWESRACPRPWPHVAHGPWFTGEAWHPSSTLPGAFDCPGVPFPAGLSS